MRAIEAANGDILAAAFTMKFSHLIRANGFGVIQ
jgi:hypothetical protein